MEKSLIQKSLLGGTHLALQGKYLLVKRKAGTGKITQTLEFSNLITNAGLDRFGVGNPISFICLGTSSSTPTNTDTVLGAGLAASTTSAPKIAPEAPSVSNGYKRTVIYGYRFSSGVAVGNLTEIGAGWGTFPSDYILFSRALIKDGSGNPTTLTVLSDETLDVYYTVFHQPDLTDHEYDVTLNGVLTHVTGRPYNVSGSVSAGLVPRVTALSWMRLHDSGLAAITNSPPQGIPSPILSTSFSTYINSEYKRQSTWNVPLNSGNGNIKLISLYTQGSNNLDFPGYQFLLDPVITKTSSDIMTVTVEFSWGRG